MMSTMASRFQGSIVALVTPFKKGEVDWQAFDKLIEWHIEQGSHGLVPCGTTGEASTLDDKEHIEVIKRCVDIAKGHLPVIAGTGSNNTSHAIDLTKAAQDAGADAALCVTPYYNKPSPEGLYLHFKSIHDSTSIPLILYNIPGRSVVDMSNDLVARLSALSRVNGIKDASNDLSRPVWMRKNCHENFVLLSGEDPTASAYLAQGGHGCISVTANIIPRLCAQMHEAWQNRDMDLFSKIRDRIFPLHAALFYENSPAPTKYALSRMGMCEDETRLPVVKASPDCRKVVDKAIEKVLEKFKIPDDVKKQASG